MSTSAKTFDIAVIGAGIAGASVAAALAEHTDILLLDMESHAGYHSTGRSAAMYIPSYGPAPIQAFTRASGAFFNNPPTEFGESPLLKARSELLIAREDQLSELNAFYNACSNHDHVQTLNAQQVQLHCPFIKSNYAAAGVIDNSGSDIDVHNLHNGFLKQFRGRGGTEIMNATVQTLRHRDNIWSLHTSAGVFKSKIVINAAGAWADQIAKLAGAESIGLIPKRRTALTIAAPANIPHFTKIPLVADISEAFYIKPDANNLLISPANEDPMPPCDVQPEEMDIALCIDQIEHAFDIKVTNIISKWAGLRSFVADKAPVTGYSNMAPHFYWLAGQGGYGIQSSPALARYAAAGVLGQSTPTDITEHCLNTADVSIDRFN